jgi:hypothetical protein
MRSLKATRLAVTLPGVPYIGFKVLKRPTILDECESADVALSQKAAPGRISNSFSMGRMVRKTGKLP